MGKIKFLDNQSASPVVLSKSATGGGSGVINRGGFALSGESRKFGTAVVIPQENGRHLFLMTAKSGYQIYRGTFKDKKATVYFLRLSDDQTVRGEVERDARYRLQIPKSGDPELIKADQETSG